MDKALFFIFYAGHLELQPAGLHWQAALPRLAHPRGFPLFHVMIFQAGL
jgi:hypothetical protein